MVNPGMFGITPQQMQAAREVGKHLTVEIRKCPRESRLEIRYIAINPGDAIGFMMIRCSIRHKRIEVPSPDKPAADFCVACPQCRLPGDELNWV